VAASDGDIRAEAEAEAAEGVNDTNEVSAAVAAAIIESSFIVDTDRDGKGDGATTPPEAAAAADHAGIGIGDEADVYKADDEGALPAAAAAASSAFDAPARSALISCSCCCRLALARALERNGVCDCRQRMRRVSIGC
jgi:hypothetical protein